MTLKFDGGPSKTIGNLFYATSSFVHHFVAIGEFKLEFQSGNAQSGSNLTLFRTVWPWNLTYDLEQMWIQTGVRVRKRLSWVLTSVTLTFDLWPWPFAWTSLLTMVITPENFMMIRWWEHGEKGVTDRQTDGRTDRRTDGRTDWTSHIAAWSQLKTIGHLYLLCYFKICASFRSHWWIQTGVRVRKRPIWVKFDTF